MTERIEYRPLHGYKYQLRHDVVFETGLTTGDGERAIPGEAGDDAWVRLERDGRLHIRNRYAWDGPSGPVPDSKVFMRASLVHDALYQLIRQRRLPLARRREADEVFGAVAMEDGVPRWMASTMVRGLWWFGEAAAQPGTERPSAWAPDAPEGVRS